MTTAVAEIRQFRQKNPSEKFPYPFRDPDRHQNQTSCCLVTHPPFQKISLKCVHKVNFLSYPAARQTDRHTKEKKLYLLCGDGVG